jgi:hypothetical protein
MGSAAMLIMPQTVQAQDGSAVSTGSSDATDNSAVNDSEAFGADASVADPNVTVPAITGSWSGPADDNRHGVGTVAITFSQLNRLATGSWTTDYGDNSSLGGTAVGKLGARSLKLVMDDPTISRKCRIKFSAKVTVSNGVAEEIKGKYGLDGCFKKNSRGTFDLTPTS